MAHTPYAIHIDSVLSMQFNEMMSPYFQRNTRIQSSLQFASTESNSWIHQFTSSLGQSIREHMLILAFR